MLCCLWVYESVPESPWRRAIDGSISGMNNGNIKVCTGAGNAVQWPQSRIRTTSRINIHQSQSWSCMYDVFKVHQSHHISKQLSNVNCVRISQQTCPQDQDNLTCAHVPSACIFSGCQSVHMHRCSQCAGGVWRKHRAGRRKTDLIGWFWCVMCSLGYSRICNEPSEHGSESLIECAGMQWYHISHQVNLECLLNRVLEWIVCHN